MMEIGRGYVEIPLGLQYHVEIDIHSHCLFVQGIVLVG
jgi:hypothetical protein